MVRIRIVLYCYTCSWDWHCNPKQHLSEIDVAVEDATVGVVVAGVVTDMRKTLPFGALVVVVAVVVVAVPLVASPFPFVFVRRLISLHVSTGIPDDFCGRNWGMPVAWHRALIFCCSKESCHSFLQSVVCRQSILGL